MTEKTSIKEGGKNESPDQDRYVVCNYLMRCAFLSSLIEKED